MIINDRSVQAAGRILGLALAKVIAAKKGQSVVLYIYCNAIEDLQQLHDSVISGRLKESVELWFNSLLIRSQETKVVALTTDFKELQKMITYLKGQNLFSDAVYSYAFRFRCIVMYSNRNHIMGLQSGCAYPNV